MIYLKNIRKTQTVFIPRTVLQNESYVVIGGHDCEDDMNLQEKTVIISTDTETVLPDMEYDALAEVYIDATEYGLKKRNEGYNEGYNTGTAIGAEEGYNEGYKDGKDEGYSDGVDDGKIIGINEQKQKLVSITITENGTYTKEDGYDSVTVNIEDKNGSYDEGYTDGYKEGYDLGKSEQVSAIELRGTNIKLGNSTFKEIPSLENNIDFKGVEDFSFMFRDCTNLENVGGIETGDATNMEGMFMGCNNLTSLKLINTMNVTTMQYMFEGCSQLKEIPHLDTSNVTNMGRMFNYSGIEEIPMLDTSNVTDMYEAFSNCIYLREIPDLDYSNVTNFWYTFNNCCSIEFIDTIDLFGDGVYGRNCAGMFCDCTNLKRIDRLSTSKVYDISEMFKNCRSLESLPQMNMSGLTTKVNNLFGEYELTEFRDFGGFNGLKVSIDDEYGFAKCPNLSLDSCMNILNGLYDFTANNEEPNYEQGELRVHQNFIDTVGSSNITMLANEKGWTIKT